VIEFNTALLAQPTCSLSGKRWLDSLWPCQPTVSLCSISKKRTMVDWMDVCFFVGKQVLWPLTVESPIWIQTTIQF